MNRRQAIGLLGAVSAGALVRRPLAAQDAGPPPLAPGLPMAPTRIALIEAFKEQSKGLDQAFERRTHQGDWAMPYRLFRPASSGPLPLVMYLHGSGGLGTDNLKQLGLGNIFGTRVWALPANQNRFPCYIVAPQTDRGWVRYGPPSAGDSVARVIPGLGDGARLALEVVDALRREFAIDDRRIYLAGQSMGGAGVWHLIAERPGFFAAAVSCCGSPTSDDPRAAVSTPLWNFHGDADQTVTPTVSRDRIAALRSAGGRPVATEYSGVGHNAWEWAFTEPALPGWLFSRCRPTPTR